MHLKSQNLTIKRRHIQAVPTMIAAAFVLFSVLQARGDDHWDDALRPLLVEQGIRVPDSGLPEQPNANLLLLGQALFFDHELSGNRDIACATCHHPTLATTDSLPLPIGTGAIVKGALGKQRQRGPERHLVPRNAPDIFNRGSTLWRSQFWDSRVAVTSSETSPHQFVTPAGASLPPGLTSVLAAQAMFPVTSRDEMRGKETDDNELSAVADNDFEGIWNALAARLLAIPGYRKMFRDAYNLDDSELDTTIGFEHAANAIANFEAEAFTFLDSPFDRYLAGDDSALSAVQKRGALLFFGEAKCSQCHSGPLLTDQRHHNLLIPHLGPGKVPLSEGLADDPGLALQTLDPTDAYRFRTPPLRNVTETGPYMHNGAYTDLEAAVRHHLDTIVAFTEYDPLDHLTQLDAIAPWNPELIAETMPGDLAPLNHQLTRKQLNELMRFLEALTAPQLHQRLRATIPESVPSGLPLDNH